MVILLPFLHSRISHGLWRVNQAPHVMSSTMIIHSLRNFCSFYPLLVAIVVTLSAASIINHTYSASCLQSLACVLFDIEGIMQPHLLPYHHLSVVYPVSSEFFCVVFVSRTVTVFSRMYPVYLLYIRSRLAGTILGWIVRNASYGSDHLSVRIQRILSR